MPKEKKSLSQRLEKWFPPEHVGQVKALLRGSGGSWVGALPFIEEVERAGLSLIVPSPRTVAAWRALIVKEEQLNDVVLERGEDYVPEPVEERLEPARELVRRTPIDPFKVAMEKKILVLDIETVMGLLTFYGLYSDFRSPKDVVAPGSMLCFAAKFVGDPTNTFYFVDRRKGYKRMLEVLWHLLNQADVVVTWNGNRFDLPKIEGQFLKYGLSRPSPYKSVDLMVAAKRLGYESKALDYVGRMLSSSRKVEGDGAGGWKKCLGLASSAASAGMSEAEFAIDTVTRLVTCGLDETPEMAEAWRNMKAYNKGDIVATEDLFFHLLPFIKGIALHDEGCPLCGTREYTFSGYHETPASRWQVRRCAHCTFLYRVGVAERRSSLLMARPL